MKTWKINQAKRAKLALSERKPLSFSFHLGRAPNPLSLSLSLSRPFSSSPLLWSCVDRNGAETLPLSTPSLPRLSPASETKNSKQKTRNKKTLLFSPARLPRRRARRGDRPLVLGRRHQRRRLRAPRVQPGHQTRHVAPLPQRAALRGRPGPRRHHRAREEQAVEGPRAHPLGKLRVELGDGGRRLGDDKQVQRGLPR